MEKEDISKKQKRIITRKENFSEKKINGYNLVGKKFGKLLVTGVDFDKETDNKNSEVRLLCRCDCGRTTEVRPNDLIRTDREPVRSCGCDRKNSLKEIDECPLEIHINTSIGEFVKKNPSYNIDKKLLYKDLKTDEKPVINSLLDRIIANANISSNNVEKYTQKKKEEFIDLKAFENESREPINSIYFIEKDEDNNIIYDENGNPKIIEQQNYDEYVIFNDLKKKFGFK